MQGSFTSSSPNKYWNHLSQDTYLVNTYDTEMAFAGRQIRKYSKLCWQLSTISSNLSTKPPKVRAIRNKWQNKFLTRSCLRTHSGEVSLAQLVIHTLDIEHFWWNPLCVHKRHSARLEHVDGIINIILTTVWNGSSHMSVVNSIQLTWFHSVRLMGKYCDSIS